MQSSDFKDLVKKFLDKMAETVIGQEEICRSILMAYIASGHILLEGVPGLAKTLIVKSFAKAMGLDFKRIQFTPDLLPADIIGTLIFKQNAGDFAVRKGPIFANIILADEINRAPAKVQSALLEAMAERQVTIGSSSYELPSPFFVLATQNPIEQEGTYPLPEAELDRFIMKIFVPYPSHKMEVKIVQEISKQKIAENKKLETDEKAIISVEELYKMRQFCDDISVDESITNYIVSLVMATRPSEAKISEQDFFNGSYLSYISVGASPRASIALQILAKIEAAFCGRTYVIPDDVKNLAYPVLRHRLKLSYEAIAENMQADDIIEKILSILPQP